MNPSGSLVRSMLRFGLPARRTINLLAMVCILLLAAYLRLNHLGWTEFKLDEAQLSQVAYNMARHGQIPLTSIRASVGVANLPLGAWVLAIAYSVSPDPLVATGFVALLNVLAVAACFWLARQFFRSSAGDSPAGMLGALAATLLFAAAPWAVIYSRKLWANDLLPPFVVAWAWTGWLAFVKGRSWALIGHALLLAACIQLHYSALMLAPATAVWGLVFIRRLRWQAILGAATIFVIAFAPFLIDDSQHGWPTVNQFVELGRQPAVTDTEAIEYSWLMTTGQAIHSLAGPQEFENYLASLPNFDFVQWPVGLAVAIGLAAAVFEAAATLRRRAWTEKSAAGLMLSTWLVLPMALQLSHRTTLYPHYFLILYPAPYLLVGWLVVRLMPRLRPMLFGLLLLLALIQAYQVASLQRFVATRATPGGFGVPIGSIEAVVDSARAALRDGLANEILVTTQGSDPAVDDYPAVFDFLLNDIPHRFEDVQQSAWVYSQQPQVQIVFAPNDRVVSPPFAVDRELIATVSLRAGEQSAQVKRWAGYTSRPCPGPAVNGMWANGVTLLAVQVDRLTPGQTATIRVCFQIGPSPDGRDYHWTQQLFDASGKRWAQIDGAGYPSRYWRPADVIVQEFRMELPGDLPAGMYALRIGQYTYPDIANVPVVDTTGRPQSDAVEMALSVAR